MQLPREMQRAVRNTVRFPRRTVGWMARLLDPNYALERRARSVNEWVGADNLARLRTIPGNCSERECRLLAHLATIVPAGGVVVEVGAWKGRVTAWLVAAAERRRGPTPLHSIDPHTFGSWDEFSATVKNFRLAERGLVVHRADSRVFGPTWSQPIAFLWIDGSHDYDDVRQDIANFTPHVIPNGLVAFDDSVGGLFPGVERAIQEWQTATPEFETVSRLRNVSVFRKKP